jgi:rusticyanin
MVAWYRAMRAQPARWGRSRWVAIAVIAGVLAATGLGTGLTSSLDGMHPSSGKSTATSYDYYQSVIGRYGAGSMMGRDSYGWMTGSSGYGWMMGGASAPAWMRGEHLPGFMMDDETAPGKVMGRLFANAPGPRLSPSEATRLAREVPAGATADPVERRLTFMTRRVHLVVLASPSMPAESFRIGGMTNPTIVVPKGATVSIELVNADAYMAHGFVVTASGAASLPMPMMIARPAFSGAFAWFLGEATSAGMHTGTFRFTADVPGTFTYLCPVPGHAEEGMAGTFVVSSAT